MTRAGFGLLALGIACWFGAVFTGWGELAVLAAVALTAVLAGLLWAVGRPRLEVVLTLAPRRVVVDGTSTARIQVRNVASRRMRPLRLEIGVGPATAHLAIGSLAPGARRTDSLDLPTARRAVVPVGPVTSVRGDPLGLVRREITWTGTATLGVEELFVHARTVEVASLTAGRIRDLEGEATDRRSPHDLAFHTLREYRPGDDLRHVHWLTTARQTSDDVLMIREFVDTRRTSLALLMATHDGEYRSEAEFELAASIMASIGLRCLRDREDLVCLAGLSVLRVPTPNHLADAVSRLERSGGGGTIDEVVRAARRPARGAAVAVLVTGSGVDPVDLSASTGRLDASVHPIVIRATPGSRSRPRSARGVAILDVGSLEDLPRLLTVATRP